MDKALSDSYKTVEWQRKRNHILERDNYTCALCGSHGEDGSIMHVHHKTYKHCKNKHAWDCPDDDLVTLCDACHKAVHSKEPYDATEKNFAYYEGYWEGSNEAMGIAKYDISHKVPDYFTLSLESHLMGFFFTQECNKDVNWGTITKLLKANQDKLPFIVYAGENDGAYGYIIIVHTPHDLSSVREGDLKYGLDEYLFRGLLDIEPFQAYPFRAVVSIYYPWPVTEDFYNPDSKPLNEKDIEKLPNIELDKDLLPF